MPGGSGRHTARVFVLVVLALLGLVPSGARAAIINVDFTGRVIGFSGEKAFETDVPVAVGDSVVGWWSYDTEATAMPFGSQQLFIDPTTGFSFTVSGGVLTLDYDGSTGGMTISNGLSDSRYLSVSDHTFSGTTGSIRGTEFRSSITYDAQVRPNWVPESALMWFTDTITGPPLPDALNGLGWHLQYRTWRVFTNSDGSSYIGATGGGIYIEPVTVNFTQIPEPATLALVGLGLAALGAARRRL